MAVAPPALSHCRGVLGAVQAALASGRRLRRPGPPLRSPQFPFYGGWGQPGRSTRGIVDRRTRATNDGAKERDDFRACGQSLESPESATLAWVPRLSVKVKDELGLPMGLNIALPRMPRAVYTGQQDGVWNITLLEPSALASKIGGIKVLLAFQKCFNGANRILSYEQLLDFSRERIGYESPAGVRNLHILVMSLAGTMYEIGDALQDLKRCGWRPARPRLPEP